MFYLDFVNSSCDFSQMEMYSEMVIDQFTFFFPSNYPCFLEVCMKELLHEKKTTEAVKESTQENACCTLLLSRPRFQNH